MILNIDNYIIDRIHTWNLDRNLITKPSNIEIFLKNEHKMLQEELDEYMTAVKTNNVYEQIDALCDITVVFVGTVIKCSTFNIDISKLNNYNFWITLVNTINSMIKELGFEFNCVMNETLKEIESRIGKIDTKSGKFIKDKSEEARKLWYKADYSKCLIVGKLCAKM